MKLYLIVKDLLQDREMRNSDKKLLWAVWEELGLATDVITKEAFLSKGCPVSESVTRVRRKLQENHPELQADELILKERQKKASKKGFHVYHEEVTPQGHWEIDKETNTAKWVKD